MFRSAVFGAIVATLLYLGFQIYGRLDVNLRHDKHLPGKCRPVPGFGRGSEDFQVTSDGLAFVTSGLSAEGQSPEFQEYVKKHNIRGRIYMFNFTSGEAKQLKIQFGPDFDKEKFFPLGISLLEDKAKGEHLLYVVNLRYPGGECIEKFRYTPTSRTLNHVKTFESKAFVNLNNIAVVAEDKFYYTIFRYSVDPFLTLAELIVFNVQFGSVGFFDGERPREMVSVMTPNGITMSSDGRFVYVSLYGPEKMAVFQRHQNGSLSLVQEVPLSAHPDNSHLSDTGDALYVGSGPSISRMLLHVANPENPCPSAVLRLPLKDGLVVSEDVTEVLYDHGDLISAASIAVARGKRLLVGSILHRLILCDM